MAWVKAGVPSSPPAGLVTTQVTVPAGITAGMTALLCVAGAVNASNETPVTVTLTKTGATFTTVVPTRSDTNQWWTLVKATGLVAGDVVTATISASRLMTVAHNYFDTDFGAVGTVGTRGGVSQTTVVAPALTVPANSRVYVVGVERTTANGVTVAASNANGRAVTVRDYYEAQAGSVVSTYLAEFVEPTTSAGATTLTYSSPSTNASAVHLVDAAPILAKTTTGTILLRLQPAGVPRKGATSAGSASVGFTAGAGDAKGSAATSALSLTVGAAGVDTKRGAASATVLFGMSASAFGVKQGATNAALPLALPPIGAVEKGAATGGDMPAAFTLDAATAKDSQTAGDLAAQFTGDGSTAKSANVSTDLDLILDASGLVVAHLSRDITITLGLPTGNPLAVGAPHGYALTVGAAHGHPLTLRSPETT